MERGTENLSDVQRCGDGGKATDAGSVDGALAEISRKVEEIRLLLDVVEPKTVREWQRLIETRHEARQVASLAQADSTRLRMELDSARKEIAYLKKYIGALKTRMKRLFLRAKEARDEKV